MPPSSLPPQLPPLSHLSLSSSSSSSPPDQPPPPLLSSSTSSLAPPSPTAARLRTPLNGGARNGQRDQEVEEEQRRRTIEERCGHLRLCPDGQRPGFEMLVLGCGGGPIETNLSSFLVKPYGGKWVEGCTGIEGGSTIGALSSLIERNPYAFEGFGLEIGVDAEELERAEGNGEDEVGMVGVVGVGREGGGKAAAKVWDLISCFAITHAHLDHIAGLIISSAACRPPPKPVYGIKRTIENIERVMDGGVWPMLGGWDDSVTVGRAYHYKHIPTPTPSPLPLSPSLSFHAFPLSHGLDPSAFHRKKDATTSAPNGHASKPCDECYDSTAFFVKEDGTGKELLFFGDVEPDSISKRGLNLEVWKIAAPKIAAGKLSVIFLECSYPSSQPPSLLFGHFSPPYILEEMVVLARLVTEERVRAGLERRMAEREPLEGVIVVIQHIKDDIFALPKPAAASSSSNTATPAPPAPEPAAKPKRGSTASSITTSSNSDKDLPPLPPPKDKPPSSHSRQTSTSSLVSSSSPSPTKPSFPSSSSSRASGSLPPPPPPPHRRGADSHAPSSSSSNAGGAISRSSTAPDLALRASNPPTTTSPTSSVERPQSQLLSMGPPVPSAPTRRPSVATGGFAFPSSPLATALSRNSGHYRMSIVGDRHGLLAPGQGQGQGMGWQNSFAFADAAAARRASTPAPFGFFPAHTHNGAKGGGMLGNPFAHAHAPQGRLTLSPGSIHTVGGAHSAPPSSAGGLAPAFEFEGGVGGGGVSPRARVGRTGGMGGTSPGRSPNRGSSHYAFPFPGGSGGSGGGGMGSVAGTSVDEREEEEEEEEKGEGKDASPAPSPAAETPAEEEGEGQEEDEEEEDTVEETVHERIERELNELEEKERTGVKFLIAVQGMRLVF